MHSIQLEFLARWWSESWTRALF